MRRASARGDGSPASRGASRIGSGRPPRSSIVTSTSGRRRMHRAPAQPALDPVDVAARRCRSTASGGSAYSCACGPPPPRRSAAARAAPGRTAFAPSAARRLDRDGTPRAANAVSSGARTAIDATGQTTAISSGATPSRDQLQASSATSSSVARRPAPSRKRIEPSSGDAWRIVVEELALEVRERRRRDTARRRLAARRRPRRRAPRDRRAVRASDAYDGASRLVREARHAPRCARRAPRAGATRRRSGPRTRTRAPGRPPTRRDRPSAARSPGGVARPIPEPEPHRARRGMHGRACDRLGRDRPASSERAPRAPPSAPARASA